MESGGQMGGLGLLQCCFQAADTLRCGPDKFLVLVVHSEDRTAIGLRLHGEHDSVSDMRNSMTQATTAKCLRCGRMLRAASSVRASYGRWCAAKIRAAAIAEAVKGFAATQVEKARELIEMGGLVPVRGKIFRAVSSKGDASYLVARQACGCPAGLHDRMCYHRVAVAIVTASKGT